MVVGAVSDPAGFWAVAGVMLGLAGAAFLLPVVAGLLAIASPLRWLPLAVAGIAEAAVLAALALSWYWLPTGCYQQLVGACGAAVSGLTFFFAIAWPPVLGMWVDVIVTARRADGSLMAGPASGAP